MTIDTTDPTEERFDPAEPYDSNLLPPATVEELALQRLYRDLTVAPPPADLWEPLLADLADRHPAARQCWADLAARVRTTPVPDAAAAWAPRTAALHANLAARAAAFAAHADWLTAQTRALPVPPPTDDQWAFQTEALQINLARRRAAGDRIERLTRETPVDPQTGDPDEIQTDWLAVETAIRQGHTETPPAVAPQRWDRMWNRIQGRIEPSTAAPASATSAPTAVLRPQRGFFRWAAAGLAAAALAFLAVTVWHQATRSEIATPELPPPALTAALESAEILDMGTVDDSVTTVVRTTSGDNPVTVVVIVNQ